ncbi:hypothetical protein Taro_045472 [Colocasia esculenta]|uniref:Uncharacterized protein n=1 Tax=Colocasia esculenta TaxID=4460 RepID=A0A843X2U7_COLES|nr:hypothetical protein [Colocasia esculenta]
MPPYRARLYGYTHLDAYVLPARRARLRDVGYCAYMYMFLRGDSAQVEGKLCQSKGSVREHIHIITNSCSYVYVFLRTLCPSGGSARKHTRNSHK